MQNVLLRPDICGCIHICIAWMTDKKFEHNISRLMIVVHLYQLNLELVLPWSPLSFVNIPQSAPAPVTKDIFTSLLCFWSFIVNIYCGSWYQPSPLSQYSQGWPSSGSSPEIFCFCRGNGWFTGFSFINFTPSFRYRIVKFQRRKATLWEHLP